MVLLTEGKPVYIQGSFKLYYVCTVRAVFRVKKPNFLIGTRSIYDDGGVF